MSRLVLTTIAALLIGVLAIRNAAVLAFAQHRPELAAAAWRSHPEVATQLGLAEIGRATAEGRVPQPATLKPIRDALRRDPLAADPFLVEGANALSSGDARRGEALLSEAVRRDPRLPSARFLLADLYVRQGRTDDGLRQIAALIRRLPKAAAPLTPSLAAFARQPGAALKVRAILNRNPILRGDVLATLATDSANAQLILSLAGPTPPGQDDRSWQRVLLSSLVTAGDYRRAYRLWSDFSGAVQPPEPGLFNPRFEPGGALAPFNWTLTAGAQGVAEPASGGGLHVLFYGRENAVLASQILLLKPGSYRLRYEVSGGPAGTVPLTWAITCLPAKALRAEERLGTPGELAFSLPPSCSAQELQLRGEVAETPATMDLTITRLELVRGGR